MIFMLLLFSVVFANSYVQAISKEERLQTHREILEQKVKNNEMTEEAADAIYKNIEERITNCDNIACEQYENCQNYQQNNNCMIPNNQSSQRNYHHRTDCDYNYEYNENCQFYQQNSNNMIPNNQDSQRNYHHRTNRYHHDEQQQYCQRY